MHELSIAMSLTDMAAQEAERRGSQRVLAIHLRIGALSGVVGSALLSAYELATEGTALDGSRLLITEIPARVWCPKCETERDLESIQRFVCAECGTPTPEVLEGREMEVFALELEE